MIPKSRVSILSHGPGVMMSNDLNDFGGNLHIYSQNQLSADLRLAYFPKNRPSTVVYMYHYESEGSQTCMYTCNSMRETSNEGKGSKLEILVEVYGLEICPKMAMVP